VSELHAFAGVAQLTVDELQRQATHHQGGGSGEASRHCRVVLRGAAEDRCNTAAPEMGDARLHGRQAQQGPRHGNADTGGHEGVHREVLVLGDVLGLTRSDLLDRAHHAAKALIP